MKKKTIIKKSDIYPVEKVNERIEFYKKKIRATTYSRTKIDSQKIIDFLGNLQI